MTTSTDEGSILRSISNNTHHTLRRWEQIQPNSTPASPWSQSIIDFRPLPEPHSIRRTLIQHGIVSTIADRLSEAYVASAIQLKGEFERNMEKTIRACLQAASRTRLKTNTASIRAHYETRYIRTLQKWLDSILESSSKHLYTGSRRHDPPAEARSSFKQETLLVLEDAFHRNAYPTRSEKSKLASRTGMEFRQVHTWFQNRRNRSKRDGKDMFRAPSASPSVTSSVWTSIMEQSATRLQRLDYTMQEQLPHRSSPNTSHQAFEYISPPHAFPTPYPPVCDYDPFPLKNNLPRFDSSLARCLGTRCSTKADVAIDVHGLSEALAKIVIAGDEEPPETTVLFRRKSESLRTDSPIPWLPTLVRPPSAPLPALVCASVSVIPAQGNGYSLSRHTISYPSRQSCVSIGSGPAAAPISKGLSIALPRRTSRSTPAGVRDGAHPYMIPPHRLYRSRLSSSSSSLSVCSDSSSCSMSSSPSSEDSPLLTPLQLLVDLPHASKLSTSAFVVGANPDLDRLCTSSPASPKLYDGFNFIAIPCR